jgi:hypothetical protein
MIQIGSQPLIQTGIVPGRFEPATWDQSRWSRARRDRQGACRRPA